jgi:hypothetical protein
MGSLHVITMEKSSRIAKGKQPQVQQEGSRHEQGSEHIYPMSHRTLGCKKSNYSILKVNYASPHREPTWSGRSATLFGTLPDEPSNESFGFQAHPQSPK